MNPRVDLPFGNNLSLPTSVAACLQARLGDRMNKWIDTDLCQAVSRCTEQFGLTIDSVIPGSSTAVIIAAHQQSREVILKVHHEPSLFHRELPGWQIWSGRGMPELLGVDTQHLAMVEERVTPGIGLDKITNANRAVKAATALLAELHTADVRSDLPPLSTLIKRRYDSARERIRHTPQMARSLLDNAEMLANNLLTEGSARPVVLHGDFFPDNIVQSSSGWRAIDPQCYEGDPAFDAGTWSYAYGRGSHLSTNARVFSRQLGLDQTRIEEWAAVVGVPNLISRIRDGRADGREIQSGLTANSAVVERFLRHDRSRALGRAMTMQTFEPRFEL